MENSEGFSSKPEIVKEMKFEWATPGEHNGLGSLKSKEAVAEPEEGGVWLHCKRIPSYWD